MSATVDTTIFSEYFNNCPVLEVHGRTHSVQGELSVGNINCLDITWLQNLLNFANLYW